MIIYYYVDHTSQFSYNTGIQRCVRVIARSLIQQGAQLVPVVWDRENWDLRPASSTQIEHLSRWSGPSPDAWKASASNPSLDQQAWLLIVELVRGPQQPTSSDFNLVAQKRGLKVAWVFHDAIPLKLAYLYGDKQDSASSSHRLYMQRLAEADRVFANSRTTYAELKHFLTSHNLPTSAIRSLPLALEFVGIKRRCPSPVVNELEQRPHRLLMVGSLERRKNHVSLLKAVAWLTAFDSFDAELVLVGWPNDPSVVEIVKRAQNLPLSFQWEDSADDERLTELYQWCDCTLFVSLEEGFGLPVSESLWYGKPCLMTTSGALAELLEGGGCMGLPGPQWNQIADGIQSWLSDENMRNELRRQLATRHLRTWEEYSMELLEELRN